MTALVVDLVGGTTAFHQLVGTLHRKHIPFTSLMFSRSRAIVMLGADRRSLELLVATVERDPLVFKVQVLEGPSVDGAVDRLLRQERLTWPMEDEDDA